MGKELNQIFEQIDIIQTYGNIPQQVTGITQNSQLVRTGYIFAARSGKNRCGLDFEKDALEAGASMIITDEPFPDRPLLPMIRVRDFRHALAEISHWVFGDPSRRLHLIGVTGTDGKSSSVYLTRSMIQATGEKCGIISTIGYDTGYQWYDAPLTTPDIDRICELLNEMRGAKWCVMECSSHAMALGRLEGLNYYVAGYTNLSSEHRDFHVSMEDYVNAKSKLFAMLPPDRPAVINISDPWSSVMIEACKGRVITYGEPSSGADIIVTSIEQSIRGGRFRIDMKDKSFELATPLIGVYQGENLALATGICLGCEIDLEAVIKGAADLKLVPGRMEPVDTGQAFSVLVDYSHTAHALENALKAVRGLNPTRIFSVFGCGGNRDKSKRMEMGRIASELADYVIVTSDNPRFEKPDKITEDILVGIKPDRMDKVIVEPDRQMAIMKAISEAKPNDVILISGKGAEIYQEIESVKYPFDDRQVVLEGLEELGWVEKQ